MEEKKTKAKKATRSKKPIPPRIVKSIYVQKIYSQAFDRLAFEQKLQEGKKAPELMEEAIKLLLRKYKAKL